MGSADQNLRDFLLCSDTSSPLPPTLSPSQLKAHFPGEEGGLVQHSLFLATSIYLGQPIANELHDTLREVALNIWLCSVIYSGKFDLKVAGR